jgi:adenylate kinase
MKDLILFGVQGCGKGTQGRILVETKGYKLFETGKELRALIAGGSELGLKIKGIVEAGNLVSDEVVIEIVDSFLKNTPATEAVIFDGLPRKVTQKDLFEQVMQRYGRQPVGVLIQISDEIALQRLSNRWMSKATGKIFPSRETALAECPEDDVYQRADDTAEAIKVRLANYHQETQPVIDWYREVGRLVEVEGDKATEAVTVEIVRHI